MTLHRRPGAPFTLDFGATNDRDERRNREGHEEPALVASVSTFRDGKVVEMVHYANPDEALAAVR
jgi:ketosteroid isomerase-like protein